MKRAFGVVLLLSALSGCSSDPTPQDFERFAAQYAKDATREVTFSDGSKHNVTTTLKRHNLRKTDSLTSPFVGEAEYGVSIDGLTVRHRSFPKGKPATYHNQLTLSFGWVNGEWQHNGGTNRIANVVVSDLDEEQKRFDLRFHNDATNPVTQEESEELVVWLLNMHTSRTEADMLSRQ